MNRKKWSTIVQPLYWLCYGVQEISGTKAQSVSVSFLQPISDLISCWKLLLHGPGFSHQVGFNTKYSHLSLSDTWNFFLWKGAWKHRTRPWNRYLNPWSMTLNCPYLSLHRPVGLPKSETEMALLPVIEHCLMCMRQILSQNPFSVKS